MVPGHSFFQFGMNAPSMLAQIFLECPNIMTYTGTLLEHFGETCWERPLSLKIRLLQ